tara:strand:+ start:1025 stop:1228 length:204 start_codon:yes stop_codon:yes gene_type:complete
LKSLFSTLNQKNRKLFFAVFLFLFLELMPLNQWFYMILIIWFCANTITYPIKKGKNNLLEMFLKIKS